MILVWILLVAAAVSNASGARIVGGEATTIEQYPAIVAVEFRNGLLWAQSCGANVLTSRHLVSAAHCFEGVLYSNSNRRVRAGSTNRNTAGTVVRVSRRVNHPSYSRNSNDFDISVVVLSSRLTFGNTVAQVAIVPQGFELPDNVPVVHAGWGATRAGGLQSAVLRHVEIRTINQALCTARYQQLSRPETVTDNMICAGILDVGGKDACQGDSGGPLYYDGILVGIVSWGNGCADATYPGVSTKVSSFTDWIISIAV